MAINGMEFCALPCSAAEMDKYDHFNINSMTNDKLHSKACSALKMKFQNLDYGKLLDGASHGTLGRILLVHKMTVTSWVMWTVSYDLEYLSDARFE